MGDLFGVPVHNKYIVHVSFFSSFDIMPVDFCAGSRIHLAFLLIL